VLGAPRTLRLEATLYRATRPEGAPVLIFNHGSTGNFQVAPTVTQRYAEVAQFFVERGFTVLIPMRRGRGASEGDYLEDLDAVLAFAAVQPWFDRTRFVLGACRAAACSRWPTRRGERRPRAASSTSQAGGRRTSASGGSASTPAHSAGARSRP